MLLRKRDRESSINSRSLLNSLLHMERTWLLQKTKHKHQTNMKRNHRCCHRSACRRIFLGLESFVFSSASGWSERSSAEAILSPVQPKVSQWPLPRESKKKLTSWGGIIFIISYWGGWIGQPCSDRQGGESSWRVRRRNTGHIGRETRQDTKPPLHPWTEDGRTKAVTRRRSVAAAAAAAVVPSSAVVLLLGQLPDDPLQLFTGLLLVLQELLHPFVLLLPRRTRMMKMEHFKWSLLISRDKVHWGDQYTHLFQLVDLVL